MNSVGTDTSTTRHRGLRQAAIACALSVCALPAIAFTVSIPTGSRTLYLQVGVGSFTGTLQGGGNPGVNFTVNTVSVTVPAAQVGTDRRRR